MPLILVTNDDGIESNGLWASAEALVELGDVLIVAPDKQWSGYGRALPHGVTGRITEASRTINGHHVTAYAVDASPALTVAHAMTELASRRPDLCVSGINYGTNLGIEITISGTVGAALEAAAFGIPSLAMSLEMPPDRHLTGDENADFAPSMAFTQFFARHLLNSDLGASDLSVLNVNVPVGATPYTPWRLVRLSTSRYLQATAPDRENGRGRPYYRSMVDTATTDPDTDVWTVHVERLVSVTPISLDLTSRTSLSALDSRMRADREIWIDLPDLIKTRRKHHVEPAPVTVEASWDRLADTA